MIKHTSGKWRLVKDAQGPNMVMHPTEEGKAIACLSDVFRPLHGYIYEYPFDERTGNAELIATAQTAPHECDDPDCPGNINRKKLEALDVLIDACRDALNSGIFRHEDKIVVEAAIAKATS